MIQLINRAIRIANNLKVKTVKLDVSAPFHSNYMINTAKALQHELVKFNLKILKLQL